MRGLALAVLLAVSATAALASQPVAKVQLPCESPYQVLSPTGTQLAIQCKDRTLRLVSIRQGTQVKFPGGNVSVFSPDGNWLAIGYDDGSVEVFSTQATGGSKLWQADSHRIDKLYFFPDGKTLLVGPMNTAGTIWDLTGTPTLRTTLPEDFGGVFACAASPDGKLMAVTTGDNILRWYDTATWQKTREYRDFLLATFALTFSPDGKSLLAAGADSRITVFDAATGKQLRQMPPQTGSSIFSLDLLRDPNQAVAVYYDNAGEKPPHALIWNLTTAKSVPFVIDPPPTCGEVVNGKIWTCNVNGNTLMISQQE